MATDRQEKIAEALGIGISLIASEHFFSAGLPSPVTARKFLTTPEDVLEAKRALRLASLLSLASAGLISVLTKKPWPIITTAGLVLFYKREYERALE